MAADDDTPPPPTRDHVADAADAAADLVRRLRQAAVGALDTYTIYLGEQLGLYRALAEGGPATATELARRTGTGQRYVLEWLEQQATSALLAVDDPAADPHRRRYHLPPGHARVLADPDDVSYQARRAVALARTARGLPDLVAAFRTGGAPPGLRWGPEGRAETNRPLFLNLLGRVWLPAIPALDRRLHADPPARVADIACGTGWSSIAMAQAYPRITVDGLDLDADAIRVAGAYAADAGVGGRVSFRVADAADPDLAARYDLVTILEALHDMPRPVQALQAARTMLREGGSVLVAEEPVAETFTVPGTDQERYHYGWSVVSCLPAVMGDAQTAATGAVLRPTTLRRLAHDAGFRQVQTLPLDTDVFRFYQLLP